VTWGKRIRGHEWEENREEKGEMGQAVGRARCEGAI
jgi:hypothetical protein